ncbi:MAG: kelch repeat-containing protein, partial [Myxococcota bacterium]
MRTLLTSLLLLTACGGRDPEVRVAGMELRLLRAETCQPGTDVTQILVQALGDFPPSDEATIDVLRPATEPGIIDRFPPDTQLVTVRAASSDWVGIGARALSDLGEMGPLLLVPEGRSCPLADFGQIAPGARAVALPDGGLLVVGGEDGLFGSRRVMRLGPGERMATVLPVEDALDRRRAGHTLVDLGDRILIVGGSEGSASGPADDRYEVYDVASGRVTEGGALGTSRTLAAAAALPDGRVLVAGGKAFVEMESLPTVEVLDPDAGTSTAAPDLDIAQSEAHLVTLDDGAVIMLGGAGNEARFLPFLWAWDPNGEALVRVDDAAIGAWPDGYDVAVLEGGRAILVGDTVGSSQTRDARLITHLPPAPLRFSVATVTLDIPDLVNVRAATLGDGRVLVTGRDEVGDPRAFAFDLGQVNLRNEVIRDELDASRVPTHLLTLADGLVAELGLASSSLRRAEGIRTPFHNAPASFGAEFLALDAPFRWFIDAATGAVVAQTDDARADIATLRFDDVAIEL